MIVAKANYNILTDISETLISEEVAQGIFITRPQSGAYEIKQIERIARVCYKSEDKTSTDLSSAEKLLKTLIANGHESVLEHGYLTVKFNCDRAMSHQIVRHRIASFTQESQRYCNYSKEKFGENVTFIIPWWMDEEDDLGYSVWKKQCESAEKSYFDLLNLGYSPEQARMVLPNCTKTEIVVSANYREWRHILKLRTAQNAQSDIRVLMTNLLCELKEKLPIIFDDI